MITIMLIGGLFLAGCSGEYITREYTVSNESELRAAFASATNNEVVHITLATDIQLQGYPLQVPTGATIIISTPRNVFARPITRIAGEERHFYVPYQATLRLERGVIIQSQQSASNTAAPTVNRGGIAVNGGTLDIRGVVSIRNNRWSDGGGVLVEGGGTFNLSGSGVVSDNIADNGGGVFVQGNNSKFNMSGSGSVSENTARANGGGVVVDGNASFSLSGNGIVSENAAHMSGGGIFAQAGGDVTISGSGRISDNSASNDGGGILAIGQDVYIAISGNGNISRNIARRGGGVALLNDVNFTRTGSSSISNNTGGNIYTGADGSVEPVDNDSNFQEPSEPQPGNGGSTQRH